MDIDRCMRLAQEEHHCPHCRQKLSCCEAPPFHIGDGLGWGTDILFICLNDECSLFTRSWEDFEQRYGHNASCRYMLLPGEEKGMSMMVGSPQAFTGSIIDIESMKKQNHRFHNEKKFTEQLATCVAEKNLEPVLGLLLDNCADLAERKRAVEMLIALNDLSCVDPLRNHTFAHTDLEMEVNLAIRQILENSHRKECPSCMEVIKAQAKACKHCGKDV